METRLLAAFDLHEGADVFLQLYGEQGEVQFPPSLVIRWGITPRVRALVG